MDLSAPLDWRTIRARLEAEVLTIVFASPDSGNTISRAMVEEIGQALDRHQHEAKVVVLEGSPEVFCMGADFQGIHRDMQAGAALRDHVPEAMYALWQRLASGPFISVAHVRGKVNAGGVGFVAACDIVLCEEKAVFTLSEMLFGLIPACVLPFLVRRIGAPRANYLTVSAQPLPARLAESWGLVDACEENSENLLRKHLLRLRRLTKPAVLRYKQYASELDRSIEAARPAAVRTNLAVFSDPVNQHHIGRYVATGRFPWEPN